MVGLPVAQVQPGYTVDLFDEPSPVDFPHAIYLDATEHVGVRVTSVHLELKVDVIVIGFWLISNACQDMDPRAIVLKLYESTILVCAPRSPLSC